MDYFEGLIKTLLEHDGYWVRQSFKIGLTKQEKRDIGKHSMPGPEVDILTFKPEMNHVIAFESKSYLDSPGVKLAELEESYDIPEGRYKLFTCENGYSTNKPHFFKRAKVQPSPFDFDY